MTDETDIIYLITTEARRQTHEKTRNIDFAHTVFPDADH
jgi:hypothetical protein